MSVCSEELKGNTSYTTTNAKIVCNLVSWAVVKPAEYKQLDLGSIPRNTLAQKYLCFLPLAQQVAQPHAGMTDATSPASWIGHWYHVQNYNQL